VTDALPTTSELAALARHMGETVVGALPAEHGWSVVESDDNLIPAGARAVRASLGDGNWLVLAASPRMAQILEAGPPPASGLAAAAAAVIELAANAASVSASQLEEVPAAKVIAGAAGAELFGVRLLDGENHAASLILGVSDVGDESPESAAPASTAAHQFQDLGSARPVAGHNGLSLLHDVEMGVTAELGRSRMHVREILSLAPGAVIELDRTAGSPVDVLVNGTLIARGEVVVVDEEFGVRITEVIGYQNAAR
jgi:flagellar motor switch protein FliN/FliY